MGLLSWSFIFLLFLVEATPTWLLVVLAGFSAFAVGQIMGLLFTLPIDLDQAFALLRALFSGDRSAWASFVLLAYVGVFLLFYRQLWIACETRLALRRRTKR